MGVRRHTRGRRARIDNENGAQRRMDRGLPGGVVEQSGPERFGLVVGLNDELDPRRALNHLLQCRHLLREAAGVCPVDGLCTWFWPTHTAVLQSVLLRCGRLGKGQCPSYVG